MKRQTTRLRELLKRPGITAMAGCWDSLSAKLVEAVGFELVYVSGYAVAATKIGKADVGYLTLTEMVNTIQNIAQSIDIPMIVDADDGYGNPLCVRRTIQLFEQAGAAGCHLEDCDLPKRSGDLGGGRLIPREEMILKIKAAVEARTDPDFVIIARTDDHEGPEEAISRAKAYIEAGADMGFIVEPNTVEEMRRAAKEVAAPMMTNQMIGMRTPVLPLKELEQMGYKIASYFGGGLVAVTEAMQEWLKVIKEVVDDKTKLLTDPKSRLMPEIPPLQSLVGMDEDDRMQRRYMKPKPKI